MVIIITEGKTDIEFVDDFIKSVLEIPRERYEFKNFEGKDNIFQVSHPIYDEIEKELDIVDAIFICVDADDPSDPSPIRGYNETEDALKRLKDDLGFDVPIDYYIFCDENREGFLESFLLSFLDDEQKACIQNFRECYKYELSDKWTYNSFYKQKQHPFDFSHPNFNDLKQKLTNLFK